MKFAESHFYSLLLLCATICSGNLPVLTDIGRSGLDSVLKPILKDSAYQLIENSGLGDPVSPPANTQSYFACFNALILCRDVRSMLICGRCITRRVSVRNRPTRNPVASNHAKPALHWPSFPRSSVTAKTKAPGSDAQDDDGDEWLAQADSSGARLLVSGLAPSVDEERLGLAFEPFGALLRVRVPRAGAGYVVFASPAAADFALDKMQVPRAERRFRGAYTRIPTCSRPAGRPSIHTLVRMRARNHMGRERELRAREQKYSDRRRWGRETSIYIYICAHTHIHI